MQVFGKIRDVKRSAIFYKSGVGFHEKYGFGGYGRLHFLYVFGIIFTDADDLHAVIFFQK
jgi:hypothetical protein